MSSTTPVLFRGVVDDASVFPPAATPLADAVGAHAAHRTSWYAGCIGPLLVPAVAVAELLEVLDGPHPGTRDPHHRADGSHRGVDVHRDDSHRDTDRGDATVDTERDDDIHRGAPARHTSAMSLDGTLEVVLIARPGADPATLTAGLDALHEEEPVRVVGAELAWEQGWRDLGLDDLAVALEVPRGDERDVVLAEVLVARREGLRVVAKLRTGPTPTWPWPDEQELADFLVVSTTDDVPFKLTGGLHHAVRGTYEVDGVPEENHGLLNVLLATSVALSGAGTHEVSELLALRDARALADVVVAWTDATATEVRRAFTAYGCCTVTDPVGELADLGLLEPPRPARRGPT
jgi:hypothetical protein